MLDRVQLLPLFLKGNTTSTVPHKLRHIKGSTFQFGTADAASHWGPVHAWNCHGGKARRGRQGRSEEESWDCRRNEAARHRDERGMSCPSWQWHNWKQLISSSNTTCGALVVAWDSSRTVVVIKLRRTSTLKHTSMAWVPLNLPEVTQSKIIVLTYPGLCKSGFLIPTYPGICKSRNFIPTYPGLSQSTKSIQWPGYPGISWLAQRQGVSSFQIPWWHRKHQLKRRPASIEEHMTSEWPDFPQAVVRLRLLVSCITQNFFKTQISGEGSTWSLTALKLYRFFFLHKKWNNSTIFALQEHCENVIIHVVKH